MKKGHELNPGECLHIDKDYFNNLSITLYTNDSSMVFCETNSDIRTVYSCTPADYTLHVANDIQECFDHPSRDCSFKGYYDAYMGHTLNANAEPSPDFALIKKQTPTKTNCETF